MSPPSLLYIFHKKYILSQPAAGADLGSLSIRRQPGRRDRLDRRRCRECGARPTWSLAAHAAASRRVAGGGGGARGRRTQHLPGACPPMTGNQGIPGCEHPRKCKILSFSIDVPPQRRQNGLKPNGNKYNRTKSDEIGLRRMDSMVNHRKSSNIIELDRRSTKTIANRRKFH